MLKSIRRGPVLKSKSPIEPLNATCTICRTPLTLTPLGRQCPVCLFSVVAAEAPDTPKGARSFGEYELLEELGRGGMGVVYRAWQPALQRSVALKMLLAGPFASPEFSERFRREALLAARVQHPGIAAIHDAGEHDGQAFYTMELVEGRTAAALTKEKLPAPQEAAALLERTARAVAYAHARGVLHRDLKPSNILITADGQPKVADFGMARVMQNTDGTGGGLTLSTTLLGSPPYMAPEQAEGRAAMETTDVYALGAVLYELLTGRPPHQGSSPQEVLTYVREAVIVEPRRLNPSLPRDLETICLKCLEREPARRYATAAALADDLARFLRGEPVQARPVSAAGRIMRWCRRRPAVAALSIVSVLALFTATAVSVFASLRTANAAKVAGAAEAEARQRLHESLLAQARAAILTNDGGRQFTSLEILRQAQALRDSPEASRLALAALALPDLRKVRDWTAPEDARVRPSPRGDAWTVLAAEGDAQCRITLHRMPDGHEIARLTGLPPAAQDERAAVSQDLALVQYRGADGMVRVYRCADRAKLLETPGTSGGSFDAGGKKALFIDAASLLQQFDLTTGLAVREWNPRPAGLPFYMPVAHALFAPDGARIAAAARSLKTLLILNAASGEPLRKTPLPGTVHSIAWHPDSRTVGVACEGWVVCIHAETGRIISRWPTDETGTVLGVTFSPDGTMLATAGWDTRTRLLDWQNATLLAAAPGAGTAEAFSKDGRFLLSSFGNGLTIWETSGGRGLRNVSRAASWPAKPEPRQTTAFDPSGRWLAFISGPDVEWWTADGAQLMARFPSGPVNAMAFHPREPQLILATNEGLAALPWREKGGRLFLGPLQPLWTGGGAHLFCLDPAGDRAAVWSPSATSPGGFRLRFFDCREGWNVTRGSEVVFGAPRGPRWSPDGKWVADHVWHGGPVKVWDAAGGAAVFEEAPASAWTGTHWTHDGMVWAATGHGERIIDPAGWRTLASHPLEMSGNSAIRAAAFSPDGTLQAVAGADNQIVLRNWPGRQQLISCPAGSAAPVATLQFSPDNRRIAVTCADRRLWLWDLDHSRLALVEAGFRWPGTATLTPATTARPRAATIIEPAFATLTRFAAAKFQLPPRPPDTPPECVDLSSHCNALLTESWPQGSANGSRWGFSSLTPGLHTFGGTRFDVRGLIRLNGGGLRLHCPDLPLGVSGIRVDRKCRRLHLLLGSVTDTDSGVVIGKIAVHCASGLRSEFPLTSGEDVNGSLMPDTFVPSLTGASRIAWQAPCANISGHHVVLYQHTWVNPHSTAAVESLDFTTTMETGAPFLLAATLEE